MKMCIRDSDYGIKLLQKQFDLDDECIYELEGYMDFARYGQELSLIHI